MNESQMPARSPEEPGENREVERLLGAFAPRPARVDRDRLMFLAGRAATSGLVAPVELIEGTASRPTQETLAQAIQTTATPTAATATATVATPSPSRTPWYWPASSLVSTVAAVVLAIMSFGSTSVNRDASSGAAAGVVGVQSVPTAPAAVTPTDSKQHVVASPPAADTISVPFDAPSGSYFELRALAGRADLGGEPSWPAVTKSATTDARSIATASEPPNTYARELRRVMDRPLALFSGL